MKSKFPITRIIAIISLVLSVSVIIFDIILDRNSVLFALGGGLIGMGFGLIITEKKLRDKEHAMEASSKDERAIMLREKAGQITNGILFVLLMIFATVLFIVDADTWIAIVVSCLGFLQIALFSIFYKLLSKKY